jgi:aspartyl/asparaginyl beta-hydroxylase (cupin superfamily)
MAYLPRSVTRRRNFFSRFLAASQIGYHRPELRNTVKFHLGLTFASNDRCGSIRADGALSKAGDLVKLAPVKRKNAEFTNAWSFTKVFQWSYP